MPVIICRDGCANAWLSGSQLWSPSARSRFGRLAGERAAHSPVRIVVIPPLVGLRLWIALGRVLPLLLASERGDVEVAPGRTQRLGTAAGDEVRAEYAISVADEGVGAVPLADAEVGVELVGEGVPRNEIPAHALLQALNLGLGCTRYERESRVACVQMRGVRHLVGKEGAAD